MRGFQGKRNVGERGLTEIKAENYPRYKLYPTNLIFREHDLESSTKWTWSHGAEAEAKVTIESKIVHIFSSKPRLSEIGSKIN